MKSNPLATLGMWMLLIAAGLVIAQANGIEIETPDWWPFHPSDPAPISAPGLHVVMVDETGDRDLLSSGQREVLLSKLPGGVRDYLDKHCVKDEVGPAYRVYDKDQSDVSKDLQWVQEAMKRPRTANTWLIVSDGKHGFEGPLPDGATAKDETLKILRKYGGQ